MPSTSPASTTVHVLISGHVQGVGYRASLRDQALALGLRGWVRNLGDGRVEALLQGPQPAVAATLAWCRGGPPGARVEGMQVTPAEADVPESFELRRDG